MDWASPEGNGSKALIFTSSPPWCWKSQWSLVALYQPHDAIMILAWVPMMIPKRQFSKRGQEESWSRGFQNDEFEVVQHGWSRVLSNWPFDLIPRSYLLDMRAFSYHWRDPNSLSLPIYSSSPIPKCLVFGYLHPHVEIVPTCYSFGLEKGCLESLSLDLEIHSRRDHWHQGLVVCFLLYYINIYNCYFIFHKCVC